MTEWKHVEERTCRRCGLTYRGVIADAMFRRDGVGKYACRRFRTVCKGCEIKQRTDNKRKNREREKARTALGHHADTLNIPAEELSSQYGWHIDRMAVDIAAAALGCCCYCREPFSSMPNGLADVSLDIVNPEEPPFYTTNVRWCCLTCNNAKKQMHPSIWAAFLQGMQIWSAKCDPMNVGLFAPDV